MKDAITIDNLLGVLAWMFWVSCAAGMVAFIAGCLRLTWWAITG